MPLPLPTAARPVARNAAAQAPPPPAPGLIEQVSAAFRVTADETRDVQAINRHRAYEPLIDALRERGVPMENLTTAPAMFGYRLGPGVSDYDKIWREAKARGIANLPAAQEEFDREAYRRQGGRDADQAVMTRGNGVASTVAQFTGAAAGAFTDPINVYTLPFGGGGRTVAARILSEMGVGAAVEAAQVPDRIKARARMGEETSAADVAIGIAGAAAGAGIIRGGFEAAPAVARRVSAPVRGAYERIVADSWERLPAPLRERWARRSTLPPAQQDSLALEALDIVRPPEMRSEAENAALAVLARENAAEAGSPLLPNGRAGELHPQLLGEALQRIIDDAPTRPLPAVAGAPYVARVAPSRAELAQGTAIASGTVPSGAEGRFMARVRRAESGGRDDARNPRSTATGRYQFIDSTWISYFTRRFGRGGLSNAQILAKRGDGRIQDALMSDLTADNAAFLRQRGEAVTEGNLYLVHFAGQGGAGKLLDADPRASVESVLGAGVVRANPHLRGMSAADAIAWAHRAMGGQAPARSAGGAIVDAESPRIREDAHRDQLQRELDAIDARMAELQQRVDDEPAADALTPDPAQLSARVQRLDEAEPLPPPIDTTPTVRAPADSDAPEFAPSEPLARLPEAPPAEQLALLPALRERVKARGSLNDVGGMAAATGASEAEIRQVLTQMALNGEIRMKVPSGRRKRVRNAQGKFRRQSDAEVVADAGGVWDGQFMRTPPAPPRRAPQTVVEAMSHYGGVWDPGGDFRAMGLADWHKGKPFQRPAIRAAELGPGQNGADKMFLRLVDDGFFPEWTGEVSGIAESGGATRDYVALLMEAVEAELAGRPRRLNDLLEDNLLSQEVDGEWEMLRDHVEGLLADGFDIPRGAFDQDAIDELTALYHAADDSEGQSEALAYGITAILERNQDAEFAELGDEAYEWIDYESEVPARPPDWEEDRAIAADRGEPGVAGEDPQQRGYDGADPDADAGADGAAALARAAGPDRAAFTDPDGAPARDQADSLEHDLRADLGGPAVDPAIAERRRAEAKMRADAPLRGENATGEAQDGTMGLGLFDAADQPQFLLDENGDVINPADLLASLDDEASELGTIRNCL